MIAILPRTLGAVVGGTLLLSCTPSSAPVADIPLDGLDVLEPLHIEIAYAFEQATRRRLPPPIFP